MSSFIQVDVIPDGKHPREHPVEGAVMLNVDQIRWVEVWGEGARISMLGQGNFAGRDFVVEQSYAQIFQMLGAVS